MAISRLPARFGLTLLEVISVMLIVAILTAVLAPAVMSARERARAQSCLNNLREIGIALNVFQSSKQSYPYGRLATKALNHSWATCVLPYLEQQQLYDSFEFSKKWNDAGLSRNYELAKTDVRLYHCPASGHSRVGIGDYGGNYGTLLTGLPAGFGPKQGWSSGVLLSISDRHPSIRKVTMDQIRDGLSSTILVAEDAGLDLGDTGFWANGNHNCSADSGPVNSNRSQEIFSDHPGGAHVVHCDGSTRFLSQNLDLKTLGALCTRAQHELQLSIDH